VKNLPTRDRCSGCGACAHRCPTNCITMFEDSEGFKQPAIDADACIACGICESTCPVINEPYKRDFKPVAYGGASRDKDVKAQSSSGGMFSLFAKRILDRGGVVYGASYTKGFRVAHEGVRDEEGMKRLRGSKYMESDLNTCFDEIDKLLKQGVPVLFCGVPCNVGGLIAAVGDDENLFTVDILCHGAPSPLVWDIFLKEHEEKHSSKAVSVTFRDKSVGWRKSGMKIEFENGDIFEQDKLYGDWMRAFLHDLMLRPSCYNCAYKTEERPGDVTLGDFWGVENFTSEKDDNLGMSLMRINSEKGMQALKELSDKLDMFEVDWHKAAEYNFGIFNAAPPQPLREEFLNRVGRESFRDIVYDMLGDKARRF